MRIHTNLNSHVIPGDPKLGNTVLVVSAPTSMEGIHTITSCEHTESILYKKPSDDIRTTYVIELRFPASCSTTSISIGDQEHIFTDTSLPLQLKSLSQLEDALINTNSTELLVLMRKESMPSDGTGMTIVQKLERLKTLYLNLHTVLESDIAARILRDREDTRYISPVVGYGLPSKEVLIPGAGRPYRRDTTDGIHHGWDIMAPFGTPVQSLAEGKIIRIKNNWSWDDFNALKKGNITTDDRLTNLDIFRGNQIWLQTMDGNVTFYSHLSKISENITVGSHVDGGTYLGNIGRSGVPDRNYKNLHLHFEVQQNPFHEDMKRPNYLDIMRWEYAGENMNRAATQKKTRELFQ